MSARSCEGYIPDCPRTPCGRVRPAPKYHAQMSGRVEFERRRLGREYSRMLRSLRRLATASRGGDDEPGRAVAGGRRGGAGALPPARGAAAEESARPPAGHGSDFERLFWSELGWALGGAPRWAGSG